MTDVAREVVVVMFADLVGYSALAQRDEKLALKLIKILEDTAGGLIAKFNGRLVKTIGDALMVEFPSAFAAVACAIQLQEQLRSHNDTVPEAERVIVRIGIHLGDVVRHGDDILGDTVNIAARVETKAQPGGIAVTHAVYEQVRTKLDRPLAPLGSFDLKGIEGQTQLYQVLLPWQTPASRVAGIKLPPTRTLWLAGGAVAVAVLALLSVSMKPQPDSVAAADTRVIPEKSIVVLPFKNLSTDAANGYFADGMQDEILTLLAQLGDLRVISRSSTERYSSEPADLKTVSTQLGVAHVLEGSVQKVGDQVLINVQLIDARTDTHVWAESYRRTVTDVFTVESEVAQQVADNLKLKLDPAEVQRLNSQPTTSTDAHDLYLRAYALLNRGDAKGLEQALQLARQAVAIDPHYAAAWMIISGADVALADAYRAPREVIGEARRAALKAIDADDRLSAAHAIYGSVEFNYDWDFPLAELELKKALALDPNDDYSLFWYASYLAGHAGDFAQAHALLKRARVINPLSAWHPAWESMFAIWQGDLPEAMALAKEALKIEPGFYYEGDVLARVYAAEGDYKACQQRYQELIPTRPQAAESFEYAICAIHVGDTARGRAILAILENDARDRYVDGTHLAAIYTALGDKEKAFAALERAYQDRSAHLVYLAWNPLLKPLQTDPRFAVLVAKIGKSRFPE